MAMNRPLTLSRPGGEAARPLPTATPKPMPSPTSTVVKALPPGTDALALTELRNAAFTYDYLRAKSDPVQFWEALRLARSRRAFDAAAGDAGATPQAQESLRQELESIRRNYSAMVANLRRYLKPLAELPEPADRLEMAIAFLMASAREHQAVARWLAEPGKHEAKAAEKLRSLAKITDPYREALQPWALQVPAAAEEAAPVPEVEFSEMTSEAPPPAPRATSLDPALLDGLRRAIQCREIFAGLYLDAELWETMLLAIREPERTGATLEVLARDAEEELLEELQIDAEALYEKTGSMKSKYLDWVRSLRESFPDPQAASGDSPIFEVALALGLTAPATREQACAWLKEPSAHRKESAALIEQWMPQAEGYLKAAAGAA